MESKTYDSTDIALQILEFEKVIDADIPITQQVKTLPPPPPPSAPAFIEIIEDESTIEENIIESSESSQEMAIEEVVMRVEDVTVEEVEEEISIPFAAIENVPVFPGCEKLKIQSEIKRCFNDMIQQHIIKNFQYPQLALELGKSGRVFVQFEINKQGEVSNFQKRGPDKLLEDEAVRIMSLLPIMQPGTQRGKPVKVRYNVPINFVVMD
ncbi:protein TonB [Flavobacteriaceae bacterium MAR_2010_188]|nr:protein TonB [Flavobacteriaceae bacterium MAR_2010_188]